MSSPLERACRYRRPRQILADLGGRLVNVVVVTVAAPQPNAGLDWLMEKLPQVAAAIILLASAGVMAQSNPVTLRTEIYIVSLVTLDDGSREERFTPATSALPGQVIEYRIFASNTGESTLPAGRIQVQGPVQDGMEYIEGSATSSSTLVLTEFTADGGDFSPPPLTIGVGVNRHVVDPTGYRGVRWTVLTPAPAGWEEQFAYRVQLLGATPPVTRHASFVILSSTFRWEGDYLYVVGELQNTGSVAMGVELQAISRDTSGRLVDAVNFWPASINNIAAGGRYGFRYPVTRQRNAVTVEIQIVSTMEW